MSRSYNPPRKSTDGLTGRRGQRHTGVCGVSEPRSGAISDGRTHDRLWNQWHKHSFPKALNSRWPLRRNIRQHKAGISGYFFLTAENAEENTDDYSKILHPLPDPSPCEGDRGCIWLQRTAAIAQFPAAFCPRVSRCLCVAALPPTFVCVKASLNGVESARFAMTKKKAALRSRHSPFTL